MAYKAVMVILPVAILSLIGCRSGPVVSEGGFDSDDPASKLYAIKRAGQNRDDSAVEHLVEQLDSDDPAVRMMTIIALERITGTRLGYNPYASIVNRQLAIDAWVNAVREKRFQQRSQRDVHD